MSAKVAVIGRPNVGKSTLFNRLVGRKLALVDAQPGVTRDSREGAARLGDLVFTIIDTAGLETGDDVGLLAAGRQDDDVRWPLPLASANLAADVDARHLGHFPVEDRQPRRIRPLHGVPGFGAVGGYYDLMAVLLENACKDQPGRDVVVGYEDSQDAPPEATF